MGKTILICDDHTLFLSGIIGLLETAGHGYRVAGFTDAESCKAYATQHAVDVLLCDLNIGSVDGFTLIDELRPLLPQARILILSAYFEDFLIQKARKKGVNGFLKKETTADELIEAIEADDAAGFLTNANETAKKNAFTELDEQAVKRFRISKQEKEIIRLIVEGKSSKEIADILFISKMTVDTHRRNIYKKLDISNSSSLIKFAHENHLLP